MAFNISARVVLTGPENLDKITNDIHSKLGKIQAPVNVELGSQSINSLNQLNAALNQLNSSIQGYNTNITNSGNASTQAASKTQSLAQAHTNLNNTIRQSSASVREIGDLTFHTAGQFNDFGEQIGYVIRRFSAYTIAAGALLGTIYAVKSGIAEAIKFQTEMVRLAQVSEDSAGRIKEVEGTITKLSQAYGVSSLELARTAVTIRQAGFSATETSKALETLAQAATSPNFDTLARNAEGAIAVMNQFRVPVDRLNTSFSSINAVAAEFAVSAKDIQDAVIRSGGVFSSLGGNLNEFIALFTSVRHTTQESSESIATGLRTIFSRLQSRDTLDALQEMRIRLRYTAQEAQNLGNINLTNQFVGPYQAIQRISQALKDLPVSDPRYERIIEAIGGTRQIGRVLPLVQREDVQQRALSVAAGGGQSLSRSAEQGLAALERRTAQTIEKFQEFYRVVLNSEGFQQLAKVFLTLADSLASVLKVLGPAVPLLLTLGAVPVARQIVPFAQSIYARASGDRFPRAFAGGGYASGGPSILTPGEIVVNPPAASQIGYNNLAKVNNGGWIVPGHGNQDSEYTNLAAGSFVIRKDSVKRAGAHNLMRLANGGSNYTSQFVDYGESNDYHNNFPFTPVNPYHRQPYKYGHTGWFGSAPDDVNVEPLDWLRTIHRNQIAYWDKTDNFSIRSAGNMDLFDLNKLNLPSRSMQKLHGMIQTKRPVYGLYTHTPILWQRSPIGRASSIEGFQSSNIDKGVGILGSNDFSIADKNDINYDSGKYRAYDEHEEFDAIPDRYGLYGPSISSWASFGRYSDDLDRIKANARFMTSIIDKPSLIGVASSLSSLQDYAQKLAIEKIKEESKFDYSDTPFRKFAGGGPGIELPQKSLSPKYIDNLFKYFNDDKEGLSGPYGSLLLDQLVNTEAINYVPHGSKFLGSGLTALAFREPEGDVLRLQPFLARRPFHRDLLGHRINSLIPQLAKRKGYNPNTLTHEPFEPRVFSYNRPNIPFVLQAKSSLSIGNHDSFAGRTLIEKLPFAPSYSALGQNLSQEQALLLNAELYSYGYQTPDLHGGNVSPYGGRNVLIDVGGLTKISDNIDPNQANINTFLKKYGFGDIVSKIFGGAKAIGRGAKYLWNDTGEIEEGIGNFVTSYTGPTFDKIGGLFSKGKGILSTGYHGIIDKLSNNKFTDYLDAGPTYSDFEEGIEPIIRPYFPRIFDILDSLSNLQKPKKQQYGFGDLVKSIFGFSKPAEPIAQRGETLEEPNSIEKRDFLIKSYLNSVGNIQKQLKGMGFSGDLFGTDLSKSPELRSMGLKEGPALGLKVEKLKSYIEQASLYASNLKFDAAISSLSNKSSELDSLLAAVQSFDPTPTMDVEVLKPRNKSSDVLNFASSLLEGGKGRKTAIQRIQEQFGLAKSTASKYYRNAKKLQSGQLLSNEDFSLDPEDFFAAGGLSPLDTIPAMVMPGEYIFTPEATSRIGKANLDVINKTGRVDHLFPLAKQQGIRGYASGGYVRGFADGDFLDPLEIEFGKDLKYNKNYQVNDKDIREIFDRLSQQSGIDLRQLLGGGKIRVLDELADKRSGARTSAGRFTAAEGETGNILLSSLNIKSKSQLESILAKELGRAADYELGGFKDLKSSVDPQLKSILHGFRDYRQNNLKTEYHLGANEIFADLFRHSLGRRDRFKVSEPGFQAQYQKLLEYMAKLGKPGIFPGVAENTPFEAARENKAILESVAFPPEPEEYGPPKPPTQEETDRLDRLFTGRKTRKDKGKPRKTYLTSPPSPPKPPLPPAPPGDLPPDPNDPRKIAGKIPDIYGLAPIGTPFSRDDVYDTSPMVNQGYTSIGGRTGASNAQYDIGYGGFSHYARGETYDVGGIVGAGFKDFPPRGGGGGSVPPPHPPVPPNPYPPTGYGGFSNYANPNAFNPANQPTLSPLVQPNPNFAGNLGYNYGAPIGPGNKLPGNLGSNYRGPIQFTEQNYSQYSDSIDRLIRKQVDNQHKGASADEKDLLIKAKITQTRASIADLAQKELEYKRAGYDVDKYNRRIASGDKLEEHERTDYIRKQRKQNELAEQLLHARRATSGYVDNGEVTSIGGEGTGASWLGRMFGRGSRFEKISSNIAAFSTGAAIISSIAGQQISNYAGTSDEVARRGEGSGAYIFGKGLSSAVTYGSIGASIGSVFPGPGTAIGAGIGVGVGLVSGQGEARRELATSEFALNIERSTNALNHFIQSVDRISNTLNEAQIGEIYRRTSVISKDAAGALELQRNSSIAPILSGLAVPFSGFGIGSLANTSFSGERTFGQSIREGNLRSYIAASQYLPDFVTGGAEKDAERRREIFALESSQSRDARLTNIVRQNPQVAQGLTRGLEATIANILATDRNATPQSIRTALSRDTSLSAVDPNTGFSRLRVLAANQGITGVGAEARFLGSEELTNRIEGVRRQNILSGVTDSTSPLQYGLKRFTDSLFHIAEGFQELNENIVSTSSLLSGSHQLGRYVAPIGVLSRPFDNPAYNTAVGRVTAGLPDEFRQTGLLLGQLSTRGPDVLARALRPNPNEPDVGLEQRFLGGFNVRAGSVEAKVIENIAREVSAAAGRDTPLYTNNSFEREKLFGQVLDKYQKPLVQLAQEQERIVNAQTAAQQQLLNLYVQRVDLTGRINDTESDLARTIAQQRAITSSGSPEGYRSFFTEAQANAGVRARINTAGAPIGITSDTSIDEITRRGQNILGNIRNVRNQNLPIIDEGRALTGFRTELDSVVTVLRIYQDSLQRVTSYTQEQLRANQAERSDRISAQRRFITGSDDDRTEIVRGQSIYQYVAGQGDFQNQLTAFNNLGIPAQQSYLRYTDLFRNVRTGEGEGTIGQRADELIQGQINSGIIDPLNREQSQLVDRLSELTQQSIEASRGLLSLNQTLDIDSRNRFEAENTEAIRNLTAGLRTLEDSIAVTQAGAPAPERPPIPAPALQERDFRRLGISAPLANRDNNATFADAPSGYGALDFITPWRDWFEGRRFGAGFATGGPVYANNGFFEPKGTDTVPAMLTPEEFVINRASAIANRPLLEAINNAKGPLYREIGGPIYRPNGGPVNNILDVYNRFITNRTVTETAGANPLTINLSTGILPGATELRNIGFVRSLFNRNQGVVQGGSGPAPISPVDRAARAYDNAQSDIQNGIGANPADLALLNEHQLTVLENYRLLVHPDYPNVLNHPFVTRLRNARQAKDLLKPETNNSNDVLPSQYNSPFPIGQQGKTGFNLPSLRNTGLPNIPSPLANYRPTDGASAGFGAVITPPRPPTPPNVPTPYQFRENSVDNDNTAEPQPFDLLQAHNDVLRRARGFGFSPVGIQAVLNVSETGQQAAQFYQAQATNNLLRRQLLSQGPTSNTFTGIGSFSQAGQQQRQGQEAVLAYQANYMREYLNRQPFLRPNQQLLRFLAPSQPGLTPLNRVGNPVGPNRNTFRAGDRPAAADATAFNERLEAEAIRRGEFAHPLQANFNRRMFGAASNQLRNMPLANGGSVPAFANGGLNGEDDTLAFLSRGEFVMNKRATRNIGAENLAGLQKFAEGGLVGGGGSGINGTGLSLSDESRQALEGFGQHNNDLIEALTQFNRNNNDLVEALKAFPHTIQLEATHRVEHVINGTAAIAALEESMKELVTSQIEASIDNLLKDKFPSQV